MTLRHTSLFLLSALLLLRGAGAEGAVLALGPVFNQDFSTGTQISDYDNGGPNQFDSIGGSGSTPSIAGGAFHISMTQGLGNIGHASRTVTHFPGPPQILVFKANMTLDNITSSDGIENTNGAVTFQFGDDSLLETASRPPTAAYATFYMGLSAGNIRFRTGAAAPEYSSTYTAGTMQAVTFFMNNSGRTQSLLAPDGSTLSLNNDQVSLWIGTSLVQTHDARAPSQELTSFGIYAQSTATATRALGYDFTIDNIELLAPIPEPSTMLLLLGGTLLVFCKRFIHRSSPSP